MKRLAYLIPVALVMALVYFLVGPGSLEGHPAAKGHRLVLQVNSNEPAVMNLALNNASNVEQYYKSRVSRSKSSGDVRPRPAHAARRYPGEGPPASSLRPVR